MTKTIQKTRNIGRRGSIISTTRVTRRAARDTTEMETQMMRAMVTEMVEMIATTLVNASTARRSTSTGSTTRNLTEEITVDLRSQDRVPGPLEIKSLTPVNMETLMPSRSQTQRHLASLIRNSPTSPSHLSVRLCKSNRTTQVRVSSSKEFPLKLNGTLPQPMTTSSTSRIGLHMSASVRTNGLMQTNKR